LGVELPAQPALSLPAVAGGEWRAKAFGVEPLLLESAMELFIFARFHARPDQEGAVAEALRDVLGPSRQEAGCVSIHAFRSISDAQLFYIHSRWKDEAAFDYHASLPHTVHFIDRVEPLIDHPLDVTRAELID